MQKSRTLILFVILSCYLLIPTYISAISAPFGTGDYFGVWMRTDMDYENFLNWNSLIPNFFENYLSGNRFRPFGFFLVQLQYLIYGGNFWLFELTKLTIRLLTAYFIYSTVLRLKIDRKWALVAVSFFLFNRVTFGLEIVAVEPYLTLFASIVLYLSSVIYVKIYQNEPLSRSQIFLLAIFVYFASLSKELGMILVIFPLFSLLYIDFKNQESILSWIKSRIMTLVVIIGILLSWFYLLQQVNSRYRNLVQLEEENLLTLMSIKETVRLGLAQAKWIIPVDSNNWIFYLFIGLYFTGIIMFYRNFKFKPLILCLIPAVIVFNFASMASGTGVNPSPRYIAPAIPFISVFSAVIFSFLNKKLSKYLAPIVILLLFIIGSPSQFFEYRNKHVSQHLIGDQVNLIETEIKSGRSVSIVPANEDALTIMSFFQKFSKELYGVNYLDVSKGVTAVHVQNILLDFDKNTNFSLIVRHGNDYPIGELIRSEDFDRIENLMVFKPRKLNNLNTLIKTSSRVNRNIGNRSEWSNEGFQYNYKWYSVRLKADKSTGRDSEQGNFEFVKIKSLPIEISKATNSFTLLRGSIQSNLTTDLLIRGFNSNNIIKYESLHSISPESPYDPFKLRGDPLWHCMFVLNLKCELSLAQNDYESIKVNLERKEIPSLTLSPNRRYGSFVP
jgi:hypothetical protein